MPKNLEKVYFTIEALFKPARDIFKAFPDSKFIRLFVVDFQDEVDRYGNKIGTNKAILCKLELSSETSQKINWQYVLDKALPLSGLNPKKCLDMLDSYYYNPQYLDINYDYK